MGAALSPESDAVPEALRPRDWRRLAVQLVALAALIVLVVWANLYAAEHDFVRELAIGFGYPGLLIAAAASGFNLLVPVPIVAFFPFLMEVGFHRVGTVAVIALGMTLGDLIGYLLGRVTREALAPRAHGVVRRLERVRERHHLLPFVVMFLYAAFAPIPNELLVIPLAFLRYPLIGIFTAVLLGNIIFNGLVAFGVFRVFEMI